MPSERMTAQVKTSYRLLSMTLVVLLSAAFVVGCGGASGASSTDRQRSTSVTRETNPNARMGAQPQPAGDEASPQNAAITRRANVACERAVRSAPSLTAAAKEEIAALCFRINYVHVDNEQTMRSICQEVANASSLASEAARKRTISACYAAGMKQ
jgi:hypothetical protein